MLELSRRVHPSRQLVCVNITTRVRVFILYPAHFSSFFVDRNVYVAEMIAELHVNKLCLTKMVSFVKWIYKMVWFNNSTHNRTITRGNKDLFINIVS